jgi:GNAT superfamily N-acetyltransferase
MYCGRKSPPRGKRVATSPHQCRTQIRAYGTHVVSKDIAQELLGTAPGPVLAELLQNGEGRKCGARLPHAPLRSCARQYRRYGLLPIVTDATDLQRRAFYAKAPDSYAELPKVPPIDHPYTQRALDGINNRSRGKEVVFVSVGSTAVEKSAWVHEPATCAGGVGYGFGYFDDKGKKGVHVFNIVRIQLNGAYQGAKLSHLVLLEFAAAVRERAKAHKYKALVVTIDPQAPCFKLRDPAARRMYEKAGFTITHAVDGGHFAEAHFSDADPPPEKKDQEMGTSSQKKKNHPSS